MEIGITPNGSETPFGFEISRDLKGRVSLTDLWKSIGSPETKAPKFWLQQDSTCMFIDALCASQKVTQDYLINVKRGKSGGSFADRQIALAYAKYLNPQLHIAVNKIFFERLEEEKNPELAIDRAKNSWRKQGKTEKWISMRVMSMEERKSFTSTLKEHGVAGSGYKDCTNGIYKHLWGGGAEIIRAKKQLSEGTNCRDHMTEVELAGVRLAELLAEENIENNGVYGNSEAVFYCESASKNIAQAIMNNRSSKKIC